MNADLLYRFKEHWAKQEYALPNGMFLLTVSGGIDSMVMADLFLKTGIKFAIAHCNFKLRGNESELDEKLVNDWCSENYIQYFNKIFDTKKQAEEWKKGIQETARNLRYQWFEQLRIEHNFSKIVTAHHANDNAETLFINLFRGTGISGLHGILPEQNNIIRPLLFAHKSDIINYAKENKILYREDASNNTDDYLRNAIRRNIIPAIEELIPTLVSNINDSIKRFTEVEILYNNAIEKECKKLIEKRGQDYYIPLLKLRHRKPLATIVYELLRPFGFESSQIPQILNLINAESGHYIISSTHRIIKNRDFFIVTTLPTKTTDLVIIESFPVTIEAGGLKFVFEVKEKPQILPTEKNIAIIDFKGLQPPILLRKYKTGDYLYPFGMKMKKKKVSRLLIDEKVALHEKENTWILESNKRIVWVAGIRLDERFKVKENTENVLLIKMIHPENYQDAKAH